MGSDLKEMDVLDLWRRAMVASLRAEAPDLTARQLSLLLTVYMTPDPHTVRGMASILSISKPAVTRALDRLGSYDLVRRKVDEADHRSIFIQRTVKGSVYLNDFATLVTAAAANINEEERR